MDDEQAELYANKIMREKAEKNSCYLCEQIDCEYCEFRVGKKIEELNKGGIKK